MRALRIKPVVSPFRRMAIFRQMPDIASLFFSARKAYRELKKTPLEEPMAVSPEQRKSEQEA